MLAVGLTGGIASGKSVVRKRLAERGVATLDADQVVHELFQAGTEVVGKVASRFGDGLVTSDGAVDRKALGAIVFDDEEARSDLEAIVHPAVHAAIASFLSEARDRGETLAVVDAALMYETGSYERYDDIVVAYCPADMQRRRLMARDRLSAAEAQKRIASQMAIEEKRNRADYVVDTRGTIEQTRKRADDVLEVLLVKASPNPDP